MNSVEVRSAASVEASAISRLLAVAIRDSYTGLLDGSAVQRLVSQHCSISRINAEIGIPGGAPGWLGWLVAVEDGTVLGAAAGGVPLTGEGELYALCTAPNRRREAIGSQLLAAATDRIRAHGGERQAVSLPVQQDPAIPFYAHHGFVPRTAGNAAAVGTRLVRAL